MRLALLLLVLLSVPVSAAASGWVTVTFADGSTLAMPGTPKHVMEEPAVEGAATQESWTSRSAEGAWSARLTTFPEEDGPPGIGREEIQFMAEDMHGRLVEARAATCGSLKGWEFEFSRSRHGDIHYVLWLADPRREVQLFLKVPLKKPARAAARRFLDSLSLAN